MPPKRVPASCKDDEDQSRGSTRTIEAPLLLPTQSTGLGPVSSRKTRRILVERGKRYSMNSPVVGSSRVGQHRAGPDFLPALARHSIVGRTPWCRQLPFLNQLGLGVEHADGVAAELAKPQSI